MEFKLFGAVLSHSIIKLAFDKYYQEIVMRLNNKTYIRIQFKIVFKKIAEVQWRSISFAQTFKKDDYKEILDSFYKFWEMKRENYKLYKIDEVVFTYKILPKNLEIK